MALDNRTLETLHPSRYLVFPIPNPIHPATRLLRVAVLDSPLHLILAAGSPPRAAALLVPAGRESDWVFSTEPGHLQLLLSSSPPVSRLILVGDDPPGGDGDLPTSYSLKPINTQYVDSLVNALQPFFVGLSLGNRFKDCNFQDCNFQDYNCSDVPVLEYEDNVVSGLVLERCVGEFVGEMLVEDVELEIESGDSGRESGVSRRESRRRLRFKRMPNFVQTEVRMVPGEGGVGFMVDLEVLVHSYLVPMVAAVSLVGEGIENRVRGGFRPKALCLGVGGGALVSFLASRLGFEVVGVELDKEVVRVAMKYFGLGECGTKIHIGDAMDYFGLGKCGVSIHIGDAMEFLQSLAGGGIAIEDLVACEAEGDGCTDDGIGSGAKFDVVMVDLDCSDLQTGASAPPPEFVRQSNLLSARAVLSDSGVLVVNVIPLDRSSFDSFVKSLRVIFDELYKIDVGNEENFVLVAKMASAISSHGECSSTFVDNLRASISGRYLDSIRRI